MDWRAVRWVAMAVALALTVPASNADAFTMGEQVATTGVSNTLAKTGAPSAAQTIGSVKSKLAGTAPKLGVPKIASVRPPSGLGAGAPNRKRTSSGKSGWGDASKGWAKHGSGKGGGKWADSSGWPKADGWSSKSSKAWADGGGKGWARPGKKS